jgi:rod shape-determining protein MreB and related proteins
MEILNNPIYVKIYKNKMTVRHINSGKEITETSHPAFSSQRLLVGDFTVAEHFLKGLVKKAAPAGWFTASPKILIHPLEMIEGGLSQVEERALLELAAQVGARKAGVYLGSGISDELVIEKLNMLK